MGLDLNSRISAIPSSATLAIAAKAKAMKKEGREVFSFSAGEPDFDTPDSVKAAAVKTLNEGMTKYAPVAGIAELQEAISEKLARENGLEYSVDQIVVSNGAKHSLFNIFMTICSEGDEVIIPSPFWLSYPEMVKIAGAVPVFLDCREEDGYQIDPTALDAAITDRTRAIILNSPSNPIGVVCSDDRLEAIAQLSEKHDVLIVADEIYEKIVYDGTVHRSIGSLSKSVLERTVTINGFSKAYSMTGWRLGYFAAPTTVARAAKALQSHSTSGANTFAQYGGLAALAECEKATAEMVEAFAERRKRLYARLTAIDGITCIKPMGAFYMLPNISCFGLDSVTFATRLLDEASVAVVPGKPFGADSNIRLSYACSMENIEKGMDKLEAFVSRL